MPKPASYAQTPIIHSQGRSSPPDRRLQGPARQHPSCGDPKSDETQGPNLADYACSATAVSPSRPRLAARIQDGGVNPHHSFGGTDVKVTWSCLSCAVRPSRRPYQGNCIATTTGRVVNDANSVRDTHFNVSSIIRCELSSRPRSSSSESVTEDCAAL